MKFGIGALALLAVALLLMHLVGSRMPREHRASRKACLRASAPLVFKTITDLDGLLRWRPELKWVERLGDVGGKRRYRETSRQGALTFEVTEETPDKRLVTTIIDEGQPFGGRWTIELQPTGEDTEVTIIEDGFVNPPIFRFLSRHVFGQTATMETYLKNLEQRFGSTTH